MMSPVARGLLALVAAAYAVLGLVLFAMPDAMAPQFAWRVSPFVAMTIGGWCLGTAWAAVVSLMRPWPAVFGATLYLGLFGISEATVLALFRDTFSLTTPLSWLYLAATATTVLFAVAAGGDWLRVRPVLRRLGRPLLRRELTGAAIFVVLVGALAAYVLVREAVVYATVFPEPMSQLSLRSFGALYLAIAVASIAVPVGGGLGNYLNHATAMYGLIVCITAAALINIGRFDFATYPLQTVYLGAYLVVGAAVGIKLLRHGTGRRAVAS